MPIPVGRSNLGKFEGETENWVPVLFPPTPEAQLLTPRQHMNFLTSYICWSPTILFHLKNILLFGSLCSPS